MMTDLFEQERLSFALAYPAIGFCGLAEEPRHHSTDVLMVNFVQWEFARRAVDVS